MRRALFLSAVCLLSSASALADAPGQRLEMDVLEMNEAPSHALRRMDEAQQAPRKRRRSKAEHPGVGPYVPEALGDRGLLVPVTLDTPGVPSDPDRHDGRGNDRDHDKDQGAGHDKDHGKDHDKDHDKGNDKDQGKDHDKGHGKSPGDG